MIATLMAIVDPGDEVVVFEPFYENYGPDAILSGATPRFVAAATAGGRTATGRSTPTNCARRSRTKTRAIIVNTPNNPTGKVFTRAELELIAALCLEWDAMAVTDEIYEHIVFDGARARADGDARGHGRAAHRDQQRVEDVQRDRLARGLGRRAARVTAAIRKVHDFLTVGAAAPLQAAAAVALGAPESYYGESGGAYAARRDRLLGILDAAGFVCYAPTGAYYIMTDIARVSVSTTTWRSCATWSPRSASRPCPAAASSALASTAGRTCGSASARRTRRSRRPTRGSRGSPPR